MASSIDTIKQGKYIGLLINNNISLFSNGIIQNAYFIYECLEYLGFKCQFLCKESNPTNFPYKNISLKQFSKDTSIFNPNDYHTIMTITRGFEKDEYDYLKMNKIFVVAFICGNTYMVAQDAFLYGTKTDTTQFFGKWSPVDELWVIPEYTHAFDFIELTRGAPVFEIPHLWAPNILIQQAKERFNINETDLWYNPSKHNSKKITIVILEPNIAFFKTGWLPLVSTEKLHTMDNELIENVYMFNFPENNHSFRMASNLSVNSRLQKFGRLAIPEIIDFFNKRNTIPIFVSHQVLNSLNYLYYELLYFGYPLVHNSPDLDGCGYFYSENDVGQCANAIIHAHKHHNKTFGTYATNAKKYLERVDPTDKNVQRIWNDMIQAGICKHTG